MLLLTYLLTYLPVSLALAALSIFCQCQCQYKIYSAPITKRTWVHYIVTELVSSCYIVLKAKLKTVRFQSSPEGCSLLNYS